MPQQADDASPQRPRRASAYGARQDPGMPVVARAATCTRRSATGRRGDRRCREGHIGQQTMHAQTQPLTENVSSSTVDRRSGCTRSGSSIGSTRHQSTFQAPDIPRRLHDFRARRDATLIRGRLQDRAERAPLTRFIHARRTLRISQWRASGRRSQLSTVALDDLRAREPLLEADAVAARGIYDEDELDELLSKLYTNQPWEKADPAQLATTASETPSSLQPRSAGVSAAHDVNDDNQAGASPHDWQSGPKCLRIDLTCR